MFNIIIYIIAYFKSYIIIKYKKNTQMIVNTELFFYYYYFIFFNSQSSTWRILIIYYNYYYIFTIGLYSFDFIELLFDRFVQQKYYVRSKM